MDVQLKRGMLEVCVLTVLRRGSSYGYRLVRDVSSIIEISESTLYPILKRLEMSGFVTVQSAEHNGRLRKYYEITPAGRERIAEFVEEWKEVLRVYSYIAGEMEGDSDE